MKAFTQKFLELTTAVWLLRNAQALQDPAMATEEDDLHAKRLDQTRDYLIGKKQKMLESLDVRFKDRGELAKRLVTEAADAYLTGHATMQIDLGVDDRLGDFKTILNYLGLPMFHGTDYLSVFIPSIKLKQTDPKEDSAILPYIFKRQEEKQ